MNTDEIYAVDARLSELKAINTALAIFDSHIEKLPDANLRCIVNLNEIELQRVTRNGATIILSIDNPKLNVELRNVIIDIARKHADALRNELSAANIIVVE